MSKSDIFLLWLSLFLCPLFAAAADLSLDRLEARPDRLISFGLRVQKAPNDVSAFMAEVRYDVTALNYQGFSRGELISDGFDLLRVNNWAPGVIRIGGVEPKSPGVVQGASGALLFLNFKVIGQADCDLVISDVRDDLQGWSLQNGYLYRVSNEGGAGGAADATGTTSENTDPAVTDSEGEGPSVSSAGEAPVVLATTTTSETGGPVMVGFSKASVPGDSASATEPDSSDAVASAGLAGLKKGLYQYQSQPRSQASVQPNSVYRTPPEAPSGDDLSYLRQEGADGRIYRPANSPRQAKAAAGQMIGGRSLQPQGQSPANGGLGYTWPLTVNAGGKRTAPGPVTAETDLSPLLYAIMALLIVLVVTQLFMLKEIRALKKQPSMAPASGQQTPAEAGTDPVSREKPASDGKIIPLERR